MKLTIAVAVAVALSLGSLVARAGISHHREAVAAEAAARVEAQRTPQEKSERIALAGLDTRLHSRLRRIAAR